MKKLNLFALLFLGLSITVTFNACSDDDDDDDITPTTTTPTPSLKTIAQTAIDEDFDSLVVALSHAGLVSTLDGDASTQFTVFAPTNAAFASYVSGNTAINKITDIDSAALANVLLYHVVSGKIMSNMLTDQQYPNSLSTTTQNNEVASIYVEKNGTNVRVNDQASVSTADVEASNGVIHVIDNLITSRNVVEFALADNRFDSLVVALSTANLVGTVQGSNGITVFAPTNGAFTNLLSALQLNRISDIRPTLLDSVLKYHVYDSGNVQADQLGPLDGVAINMLGSGSVTVNLTNGAQLTTTSGQNVDIIITDVQGNNGVIHALDEVLLP